MSVTCFCKGVSAWNLHYTRCSAGFAGCPVFFHFFILTRHCKTSYCIIHCIRLWFMGLSIRSKAVFFESIPELVLSTKLNYFHDHRIWTLALPSCLPAVVGRSSNSKPCTSLRHRHFFSNGLDPSDNDFCFHLFSSLLYFFSRSSCCFKNRFSAFTFSSSVLCSGPLP